MPDRFSSALIAASLLGFAIAGPASALCTPELAASLPVVYDGSRPVVTVQVEGHDLHMLVDTGSTDSAITQESYNKLNLSGSASTTGMYGEGFGGDTQINSMVIEDVKIGDSTVHDKVLYVVDFNGHLAQSNVDGLLGYDFLQSFDIGFDLPHNRINLFAQQDCAQPVMPWQGSFDVEPFVPRHDRTVAPDIAVQLDGKTLTLTIDSGGGGTLLRSPMIQAAGVVPKALAPQVANGQGFGGGAFTIHRQQFGTFDVGPEEFSDVWLDVIQQPAADAARDVAGVIGADYLAHHQVYLDNGNGTAYLSPTMPTGE